MAFIPPFAQSLYTVIFSVTDIIPLSPLPVVTEHECETLLQTILEAAQISRRQKDYWTRLMGTGAKYKSNLQDVDKSPLLEGSSI